MSSPSPKLFALVATFAGPKELLHAAKKLQTEGYRKFDCHSPFPIHGMDAAIGLRRSPLGWITGLGALVGAVVAIALQGWTSAVEYPLVLSGKPFFSYQAFVPITFELAILGAAIFTVFGMFALNRLPTLYHPLFASKQLASFSDDGFLVSVEAIDAKFVRKDTEKFLRELGASQVEGVEVEET